MAAAVSLTMLAFPWLATEAKNDSYPRLANYYLSGGGISDEEARSLAKWDIVILGLEVPVDSPRTFAFLKQLNPDIKLLSYIDSISNRTDAPSEPLGHPIRDRYEGGKKEWILRSGVGKTLSVWPGSILMNPSNYAMQVDGKRWNDYIPEFITRVQEKQGVWDGIFFDNAMVDIAWLNDGRIDINSDGQNDAPEFVDNAWREGLRALYRTARTLNGAQKIIVTNSSNIYLESTNGRMFETVLTDSAKWARHFNAIRDAVKQTGYQPAYVVVNANTNNNGDRADWRRFRLAFTTTLLTDAYFSFDYGDKWHQQLWWYDEYDADLGMPRGEAYQAAGETWRRDFDRGLALVNPAAQTVTVDLGGEYKRLNGAQDKSVNNGQRVTQITLGAYDGIVLERISNGSVPENMSVMQGFVAGSTAELWDLATGKSVGTKILTMPSMPNGTFGLMDDLDNDGIDETITWKNGALALYRKGQRAWVMYPYDNRWRGSVSMAAGDINGDGVQEIVIAAGLGGGPHVRIVDIKGKLKGPGFFTGNKKSRGGAYIDVGDVNGDGIDEIIAGAGRGEEPWVRIYDAKGIVLHSFLAFGQNNRQGVFVAAADVDNDKKSDIIAVSGFNVNIFNPTGIYLNQYFLSKPVNSNKRVVVLQEGTQKLLAIY